jgi:hypothetical protein
MKIEVWVLVFNAKTLSKKNVRRKKNQIADTIPVS